MGQSYEEKLVVREEEKNPHRPPPPERAKPMTDPTPSQFNCLARTILKNLNQISRRRGVIDPKLYPILITALGQADCECEESHAEDALRLFASCFAEKVVYIDGFTPDTETARRALEHHFFGGGSLDDRRNFVITVIFNIDNEAPKKGEAKSPEYRKGWEVGSYRRTKENQLLWPFAKMLAGHLYIKDEDPADVVEVEADPSDEIDLTDEAAAA
jgi:hypothetical protein